MASSSTAEEKIDGNTEDSGEQEPCMTETSTLRPPPIGRQTTLAERTNQLWQRVRRSLLFDILLTCISYVN